jgi:hypothetical protein
MNGSGFATCLRQGLSQAAINEFDSLVSEPSEGIVFDIHNGQSHLTIYQTVYSNSLWIKIAKLDLRLFWLQSLAKIL